MNERQFAALGLDKGQTTCCTPFQTSPGTAITSAVVNQHLPTRPARKCQISRRRDGMKKEPGRTRTRSHLARSDNPPVKHAAPSTLFSALRRPNPENGRIWSPRRVRTNTTRLSWGRACALNPTPGRRGSHQPRSNQTPGRPFIPHRRRQRRLHRLSRSGTRLSGRKRGASRGHALPVPGGARALDK